MLLIRNSIAYRSYSSLLDTKGNPHLCTINLESNETIPHNSFLSTSISTISLPSSNENSSVQLDSSDPSILATSNTEPQTTFPEINTIVSTKRLYLSDYKPFYDVLDTKGIAAQVGKGFLQSFAMAGFEYQTYELNRLLYVEKRDAIILRYKKGEISLTEQIKQLNELPKVVEPDWIHLIKTKYYMLSYGLAFRNCMSLIFRKTYELLAVEYLSPKIADKLTKDASKSFLRKLDRLGSISGLSADILLSFVINVISFWNKKSFKVSPDYIMNTLIWLSKKVIVTSLSLFGYSTGYAVGGYFGGVNYGAAVGSVVVESLIYQIGSTLLSL